MDIYIKGQLTRQDILKAFFIHLKPARNNMLVRLMLLGLMALILIFTYYKGTVTWWIDLLTVVVILGIVSPWWMPYVHMITFDKNSPFLKPLSGVVTDEGVNIRGNKYNSNMRWTSFTHYKKAANILLLYQGPNAFNFISPNLFKNTAEWEECVHLIEKYLPSK